jgi:hypothetical protein
MQVGMLYEMHIDKSSKYRPRSPVNHAPERRHRTTALKARTSTEMLQAYRPAIFALWRA